MELRCMLRCGGHNNLGFGHNNVLGALDLVPSAPPGAASWLMLECAPRGDLLNAVERLASSGRTLSEPAARALFHRLVSGVAHCHAAGVSRGDLKPENLLLDEEGHIRLTDFGLAKKMGRTDVAKTFCGTPEYAPHRVLARWRMCTKSVFV